MKSTGRWTKPNEYIGRNVEWINPWTGQLEHGIVCDKSAYITTKNIIRYNKPCWTVYWIEFENLQWYHRDDIEKMLI